MSGKQLLLVHDDQDQLNKLKTTIGKIGFNNYYVANGGDNAWVILKTKEIDCVISAYEMKEMSGLALLKIIRREDQLSEIPFFLTDDAFTKLKVLKAGQTGVTGLFVIPYDEDRIGKKLNSSFKGLQDPIVEQAQETLHQGVSLIEDGKFDQALEVFTSLVDKKENPEYYFNIGYIKTSQGKHSEAIEAFSMATRLDRLYAKAYEEMGRAYKMMGDLEKAEEYMHMAAEIYMDTDKLGTAEEVLNEILESGTDSLNVFNTLGVLYRKKGDTEIALSQYKKALKVHPDEPYIYYNIGRLYLDMMNTEQAKKYFAIALKKDPQFDEAKQVIKAIDLGIV